MAREMSLRCIFFLLLLPSLISFQALARIPHSQHVNSGDYLLLPTNSSLPEAELERPLHRSDFPEGFLFGTATSAYQVEGAVHEGGRGLSIWDVWVREPGHVKDGSTGDVACDQYHRFEEDIELLDSMNFDIYRFSIAWTRIFPEGTGTEPNKEGVAYYNRMINALVKRGIKPYATLYHSDLPQALEDSYRAWLSPQIVDDFAAYAEACFAAFGDRVDTWITFNEPAEFVKGYGGNSQIPPGTDEKAATEPYIAAHHVLLAHATAVEIYRRKYYPKHKGVIGLAVDCTFGEPMTESQDDVAAAARYNIFQLGWFLDPMFIGDYPQVMKRHVGKRLPTFTKEQIALVKGSSDFIGLNQYTSRWVYPGQPPISDAESTIWDDQWIITTTWKDGVEIGPMAASEWLYVVPWGMYHLLKWTSERYPNIPIYITENGRDESAAQPMQDTLHDTYRIQYYKDYLGYVLKAIKDGIDIRCYLAWSLLDNFEWDSGYTLRFGLVYVDFENGLQRYPKDSAKWFSKFLQPTRPEDF